MSSYPTVLQNETFAHRPDDQAGDVRARVERTDSQLIDLVLAGDGSAFEHIFDRHKRMVANVASRYFRRPEDIEEIMQISFAKAYAELGTFRGRYDRSLSSKLVRIASNACLDTLRHQKRKPERLNCDLSELEIESLETSRDLFEQWAKYDKRNYNTPIADYWKEELGQNSYSKGAWSLYVLHQLVGEEKFRGIIRAFLEGFSEREADFEDFRKTAEKVSGKNLSKFFDEWIYGAESSRLLVEKVPIAEIVRRYP